MTNRKTEKSSPSRTAKDSGTTLDRSIQAKLGDQLRQMYNDVVSEGVPDRFADLLSKLDKKPTTDQDKSA